MPYIQDELGQIVPLQEWIDSLSSFKEDVCEFDPYGISGFHCSIEPGEHKCLSITPHVNEGYFAFRPKSFYACAFKKGSLEHSDFIISGVYSKNDPSKKLLPNSVHSSIFNATQDYVGVNWGVSDTNHGYTMTIVNTSGEPILFFGALWYQVQEEKT